MQTQDNNDIGIRPDIESSSDAYAERFSGKAGEWLLSKQQSLTEQHLTAIKPEHILDVGGGHAQNVEPIERLGIPLKITGSDNSCRKRVDELSQSGQTDFILSELNSLPLKDQQYPSVISYRIISHMLDWRGFIDELTRVSSDAVTIDFASKRSINWFSELAYRLKRGREGDTRRYNVLAETDVHKAFAKNGFKLTRRSPQFFFPMAIHRAMSSPLISNLIEKIAYWCGLNYLFGSPIISTYRRLPTAPGSDSE